jgi:carboxymethylenebutenolidase
LLHKDIIMMNRNITLNVEDGTFMNAYTRMPEGKGPFPAIIVLQEAFGVNAHIRSVCERLTKEGYLAIAPELFHRSAGPDFEGSYDDFPAVMPHIQAVTVDGVSFDLEAAYQWLIEQPTVKKDKIASIGFCLGGRISFLANAILHLSASISFYGTNIPSLLEQHVRDLHAPHLFFWGGQDNHIAKEQIDQVTAALDHVHKPFESHVFADADHAFFNDMRPNYNPEAAKEAWKMSLEFLKGNLK